MVWMLLLLAVRGAPGISGKLRAWCFPRAKVWSILFVIMALCYSKILAMVSKRQVLPNRLCVLESCRSIPNNTTLQEQINFTLLSDIFIWPTGVGMRGVYDLCVCSRFSFYVVTAGFWIIQRCATNCPFDTVGHINCHFCFISCLMLIVVIVVFAFELVRRHWHYERFLSRLVLPPFCACVRTVFNPLGFLESDAAYFLFQQCVLVTFFCPSSHFFSKFAFY